MEQEPEAHDQDGIVMQPLAAAPWVTTAPAGIRFVPTEFELVDQYLANKFLNFQVPPDTVRELDIYAYHPDELPGLAHNTRSGQVLYFFTPLKRLGGGNVNAHRKARNGSWELTQTYRGLYKTSAYENGVIRRHLKFIGNEGFKCNFLMKEYVMDVTRTNAADPVIALCIIHPPRAVNQNGFPEISSYAITSFGRDYLPAFKKPKGDEAGPAGRNEQPEREENEQPVAADP